MEGTCHYQNCQFHQLIGGEPEHCPNFKQTWWTSKEGEPKMVNDCAPIRTLIMMQELHTRLIGLQAAQEQQRNESVKIMDAFSRILIEARNDQIKRIE